MTAFPFPWKLIPAVRALRDGGVIAYPTEAVFGLGCDPLNAEAVNRILALKNRSVDKGLILAAARIEQLEPWMAPLNQDQRRQLEVTWPGPVTWLTPASELCPSWIRGRNRNVALRVSAHPVVAELSRRFGGPIVSTSANRAGHEPERDAQGVRRRFGAALDAIVHAPVGDLAQPTEIRDLTTGTILRASAP